MPRKRRVNICDDHATVNINAVEALELIRNIEDGVVLTKREKRKLIAQLNRVILHNEYATKSGSSMEMRMVAYKEAIVGLGFKRI